MRKGLPSVGVPTGAAGSSHHAHRALTSKDVRGLGPALCGNEDNTALESAPAEVGFSSGGGWRGRQGTPGQGVLRNDDKQCWEGSRDTPVAWPA
jgi:hypothetical protein